IRALRHRLWNGGRAPGAAREPDCAAGRRSHGRVGERRARCRARPAVPDGLVARGSRRLRLAGRLRHRRVPGRDRCCSDDVSESRGGGLVEALLALASGVLYAAGIYMMLRRRLAQLIIGLGLLANGTNLLIFAAGGLTRGRPPVVPDGATSLVPPYADPVPQ